MTEIDSRLLEGLRALAAESPCEAPRHVEARLLAEFRGRSRARLRNRWLAVAGGAIAAGIAVLVWMKPVPAKLASAPPQEHKGVASQAAPVQPQTTVSPSGQAQAGEVAEDFYRLPDADILPPLDSAVIVRVQLPISSLVAMGVPVDEDRANESIQADLLLGQDGLARGVRFLN